jgi:hypothetical protein
MTRMVADMATPGLIGHLVANNVANTTLLIPYGSVALTFGNRVRVYRQDILLDDEYWPTIHGDHRM